MSEQPINAVLTRKLAKSQPTAAEVPLTVARALRLSAARAAEKSVDLKLTIRSVSEEFQGIDGVVDRLSDELLLLKMVTNGSCVGISAMDTGLVAAIVEAQTMGKLLESKPDARPMTAVDASLSEPLVERLLLEMDEAASGTVLEGWGEGITQKGQFVDLRQIGLTLPQATYRILQLNVDLAVAERTGTFFLILPVPRKHIAQSEEGPAEMNWGEAFASTIGLSKGSLPVVLHKFDAPLAKLEALSPGEIIALPKCRIDRARLEMPDGTLVAKGRLGQMAGNFAFKFEEPAAELLEDLASSSQALPASEPDLSISFDPDDGLQPTIDLEIETAEVPALNDRSSDLPDQGEFETPTEEREEIDLSDLATETELDLSSIDLSNLGDD